MDLNKTAKALRDNGYLVSLFHTAEEACLYLNRQIDNTTVGMGGSKTLEEMGIYDSLSAHNQVFWHWRPDGCSDAQVRKDAAHTEVYLTSVNALSESGEMVNIDGNGNRLASSLFGHKKVYFVAGSNKVCPDLSSAVNRARNTAAPLNARRLSAATPCAEDGSRCFDCRSEERICGAMVIHYRKMMSCDMEVVLIEEDLGY